MKIFSISYKRLVKELDAHTRHSDGSTLIDGLIAKYGKFDAVDILDGFAYMVSSSAFRGCKYWIDSNADAKRVEANRDIMMAFKPLYPQIVKECEYYLTLAGRWLASRI